MDPVGYAFRVLLPLHVHCEGGRAAGCPTVMYLYFPQDRTELVDSEPCGGGAPCLLRWQHYHALPCLSAEFFDVSYAGIWPNMGYLAVFVGVFLVTNALAMRFIRHIVR